MPHCTTNFGWYLGKFLVGFTGMLFFYMVFLKEREYRCLCKARMRQFLQRKGGKPGRCDCRIGSQSKTYPCGCKKRFDMVHEDTGMVSGERSGEDFGECICVRKRPA